MKIVRHPYQSCDECEGATGQPLAQVGEEPDYYSGTANMCLDCLRKAVALLESVEGRDDATKAE